MKYSSMKVVLKTREYLEMIGTNTVLLYILTVPEYLTANASSGGGRAVSLPFRWAAS
jgi:hypothetical protein